LLVGPVFTREVVTTPRRSKLFVYRTLYVTALLVLMCTAWLVLAGTQVVRNVGDMARFGALLLQILAPLQLTLVTFFSAVLAAGAVAQEKDRRTLILLLMTRLSNHELVLGKLLASLLSVMAMLAAGLPVFMLAVLLGGTDFTQVGRVFLVTLITGLVAGSLGSTLALWREKTFQTLSMTVLALMVWLGAGEPIAAGLFGAHIGTMPADTVATIVSPLRAVWQAARPSLGDGISGYQGYIVLGTLLTLALNGVSIIRLRVWNPSREARRGMTADATTAGDLSQSESGADAARDTHVDARLKTSPGERAKTRQVWDNPILWREVCTRAYGRKVFIIRFFYLLLFALAVAAVSGVGSTAIASGGAVGAIASPAAAVLVALFFVSLVIVNSLAITSITNERDGQALDILLVTDLEPKEFILGKLAGVLWVTKEMVLLPMLLCVYLCYSGSLSVESLVYLLGGLTVMYLFVTMLGIHCGMTYANSRSAIGVSLGTVFFLFLGVVTCILMMISFSGSFQVQLAPFLMFIVGGAIGLYVALGIRNPSPAIGVASIVVPFATFYAITCFLLGHTLAVFVSTAATYGFMTLAMLVPAVYEFDVAMGRTTGGDD